MISFIQQYQADSTIKRVVLSPCFWVCFCTFFFSYPLIKSINRQLPDPKPVLYQVGDFQLTNQYGEGFGSEQLKGKFYIANFYFSSCPTVCPVLMKKMQKIQHRVRGLGTHVALLSITVDPEVDRPPRLFKESRKYHANPHVWYFLTGELPAVRNLVVKGFRLSLGDQSALYHIAHSEKLVLVDDKGGIRGFYSSDKKGINQLMIDLGLLVNRQRSLNGGRS